MSRRSIAVLCGAVVLLMAAFRPQSAVPTVYVRDYLVSSFSAPSYRADFTISCDAGDFAVGYGQATNYPVYVVKSAVPSRNSFAFTITPSHEFDGSYPTTFHIYVTCLKVQ